MTRTMYDSVTAAAIPTGAEMVAGYVDGKYAWTAEDWDRFSAKTVRVRISAVGTNVNAHVFDVESGAIWPPARVVPLVVAARRLGIDPTVYVNERNDWGPTKAAFDDAGVAHPHWWVANYDNAKTVPAGAVAKQYADPGMPGVGGHYDMSVVADFWPGVDGNTEREEDTDMQLTDKMINAWDGEVTLEQVLRASDYNAVRAAENTEVILAGQAAQNAVLAAIATDKDVTAETLALIVGKAVRDNVSTGNVDVAELAEELVTKLPPGLTQQDMINALQSVQGTTTFRQRPTGG